MEPVFASLEARSSSRVDPFAGRGPRRGSRRAGARWTGSDLAAPGCPDRGSVVVHLTGSYDLANGAELAQTLDRAARRRVDVVLDLARVDFLDAATVRAVVALRARLSVAGRTLTLLSPTAMARRLFDLCGLGDIVVPRTLVPSCGL